MDPFNVVWSVSVIIENEKAFSELSEEEQYEYVLSRADKCMESTPPKPLIHETPEEYDHLTD